jgi:hypothetical protein
MHVQRAYSSIMTEPAAMRVYYHYILLLQEPPPQQGTNAAA